MSNITGTVYDGTKLRLVIRGETAEGAIVVPPQVADEVSRLLLPDGKVTEVVKGIVCRTVKGVDEHKSEADQLVQRFGSKDQIQRQTAGLLPDDELRELVRRHVLGPVMIDIDGNPFPKFDGVEYDFTHKPGCTAIRVGKSERTTYLRFRSEPATELPAHAWDRLDRITRIVAAQGSLPPMNTEWNVHPRKHTAMCKECGETQTEFGALVSVQVAGRKLSREYALG